MGVTNSIDLKPADRKVIKQLLEQILPGIEVWAFGSRVKWTAKPHSDLDLVAFTSDKKSVSNIKETFAESDITIEIDLHIWEELSGNFKQNIEKEHVTFRGGANSSRRKIIPTDWIPYSVEDCMEAIIDYRGKTPTKTGSGVPLVTAKVIKGGRIEEPQEFIAEADYDSWMRRGIPEPGDVVLTTEAPLGEVAQLASQRVALAQRVITLRGKNALLNNTFLKYLLQSKPVQESLVSRASGTTVVGIKQRELRKVELLLPPLPEQNRIAHILGTLDDKIELNRRMNRTLEAMAQATFKSWFVDFEPTRAKVEAREKWLQQNARPSPQPSPSGRGSQRIDNVAAQSSSPSGRGGGEGCRQSCESLRKAQERAAMAAIAGKTEAELDQLPEPQQQSLAQTAALFPDSFQDSELGEIPEGWAVKTLGTICAPAIGGQWGSDSQEDGLVPAICLRGCDMADISTNGFGPKSPVRYIKPNALEKRLTSPKDLLIAASVAGPCGRPLWCSPRQSLERYGQQVIYSNFVKRFTFKEPSHAVFAEMLLMPKYKDGSISDYITGTSVPNLDAKGLLSDFEFAMPCNDLVAKFFDFFDLIDQQRANDESRTLAQLRDTLLPKLLSGELTIPEAEPQTEEALA